MLADDEDDAGAKPTEEQVLQRAEKKEQMQEQEKIKRLNALHAKVTAASSQKNTVGQKLDDLQQELVEGQRVASECIQILTIALLVKNLGPDAAPMLAPMMARLSASLGKAGSSVGAELEPAHSPVTTRNSDSTPSLARRIPTTSLHACAFVESLMIDKFLFLFFIFIFRKPR